MDFNKEIDSLKKQLKEVNRDIEGMLLSNDTSDKALKVLYDAREYRACLEEDLADAVKKSKENESEEDSVNPILVHVILIHPN